MTLELFLNRLQRILVLDDTVFDEIRDDIRFTPVSLGAAVGAVFLAALGAWLYGETVLDVTPDGWFVDTVVLGSFFTAILFGAGIAVTYLLLAQVFRVEGIPVDDFVRVAFVTHAPYALGLLVFVPEIGFTFGMLSVIGTVFYSMYGVGAAFRDVSRTAALFSVLAGSLVWMLLIPVISDPGNNYVTGVFVYSLIA